MTWKSTWLALALILSGCEVVAGINGIAFDDRSAQDAGAPDGAGSPVPDAATPGDATSDTDAGPDATADAPAAPTATLTADPAVVLVEGTTTLSWSAPGATACTLDGQSVPASGTTTVSGSELKHTYALHCTSPSGDASASADVVRVAAKDLAVGGSHTCVLLTNGHVKCWGRNDLGQLGYGDTALRGTRPSQMGSGLAAVDLGTGAQAVAISAGAGDFTCAILADGKVKCWGYNGDGELGQGDTSTRGDAPKTMGDALAAIDLGLDRAAKQIAAGMWSTCVLLDNDQLKCWGWNGHGECGIGSNAGGTNRGDEPGEMGADMPAVSLGTGRHAVSFGVGMDHACAVLDDGNAKCWGGNDYGQLGLGDTTARGLAPLGDALPDISVGTGRKVVSIAGGYQHTCAVLDNSSAKCWGRNDHGQLGQGDSTTRGDKAGDMGDALIALDLGSGITATSVTSSNYHTCALLADGLPKCWGRGSNGQLGLPFGWTRDWGNAPGYMGDNLPHVAVGTGRSVVLVRTGGSHSCAILAPGRVKCWGANAYGQLGVGDSMQRGDSANQLGDNLPFVDTGL